MAELKSVSEWLSELGTHSIYEAEWLVENFKEETGEKADWPALTYKTMLKMVQDRGLGGNLSGEVSDMFTDTFRAAYWCYNKYAKGKGADEYHGRGTQVRAWIAAIKEVGK